MTRARSDGGTGRLWVEPGEQREGLVAEVAPVLPVPRTYSFAVPQAMEATLQIGQRVRVTLGAGRRGAVGFVVGIDRKVWDTTLRPIDETIDAASYLTEDLIDLGRWIAAHYGCALGLALRAITPAAVRAASGLKAVRYARLVATLEAIRASDQRVSRKRQAIIDTLAAAADAVPVDTVLAAADASRATLRALVNVGWVSLEVRKELGPAVDVEPPRVEPSFTLTEAQDAAVADVHAAIDAGGFSATLIYGVTGSGKTEVYIHAIRRVVAAGMQAIMLVPEIALTTQLVTRLTARLPNVVVWHSGLTDAQRSVYWRRIAAGQRSVIIGPRSAVFAPCPRLGLICVDEEQEPSYKNLRTPRFHVRDVAVMRARLLGIPVVMGSATPSVETWYASDETQSGAHRGDEHPGREADAYEDPFDNDPAAYRRVVMRRRVMDLPLPTVHVIDMRDEYRDLKRSVVLSRTLQRLLGETLERGEQAIILMNRRGWARWLFCPQCRARTECPNCRTSLVVHAADRRALCHYCRHSIAVPTHCQDVTCGTRLVEGGVGTERVEDVLAACFPAARVERVDSDTMRHRRDYQRVMDDFTAGNIDVLVGTQMIAKGLDFPDVSCVGVIDADPGAGAADFRAGERLFQLVTQVAGRAGRADATGCVVVQTTNPEATALQYAIHHDFERFAAAELASRRRIGLPPYRRLARVLVTHTREETTRHDADRLADNVRDGARHLKLTDADVLGPSPCPLLRLRGRYRYDLLLRTRTYTDLRIWIHHLNRQSALRPRAATATLDVDPVSLT